MSPVSFPAISSPLFHALLRCLSWAQQFGTSRVTVSRPPHHLEPIMYHLTLHSPHPFEHCWCGFAARGKIQALPVMKLEHMTHSGFSFFSGPTSCRQITNNITHKTAQIFTLQGKWSGETNFRARTLKLSAWVSGSFVNVHLCSSVRVVCPDCFRSSQYGFLFKQIRSSGWYGAASGSLFEVHPIVPISAFVLYEFGNKY